MFFNSQIWLKKHKFTDSRNSAKLRQNKLKGNHGKIHHSQTAENQRERKILTATREK